MISNYSTDAVTPVASDNALLASLSPTFLLNILDGTTGPIFVKDRQHRWVLLNSACCQFIGHPRAQLLGKTDYDFFPAEEANLFWAKDEQVFTTGIPDENEERFTDAEGNLHIISTKKSLFRDEAGNLFIVATIRDITARIQAEEALLRSYALLKAQQEAAIDGILAIDEHDQIASYNQRFCQIWQIAEVLMQAGNIHIVLNEIGAKTADPETFLAQINTASQHSERVSQTEMILKDGRTLDLYSRAMQSSTGSYYGRIWYFRDISERKAAEQSIQESKAQLAQQALQLQQALDELKQTQIQLIQTEKMSSLGQLVAGIAHEINNPVNFIHGNLDYAIKLIRDLMHLVTCYQQAYSEPTPMLEAEIEAIDLEFLITDLPKLLGSMQIGTDRIQELVRSLRTFSRLDEAEVKAVDLHAGIDSTLLILQHRLKPKSNHAEIRVMKHYGKLPLVNCYAEQLNQVFMNILTNAIDALEEEMDAQELQVELSAKGKIPTITIQTELSNTEHVIIWIRDNGPGIPVSVRQRLFDPFFTTKPVGKGTGLGMSISYQIITRGHQGTLHCISELGAGAEFIIQIPIR